MKHKTLHAFCSPKWCLLIFCVWEEQGLQNNCSPIFVHFFICSDKWFTSRGSYYAKNTSMQKYFDTTYCKVGVTVVDTLRQQWRWTETLKQRTAAGTTITNHSYCHDISCLSLKLCRSLDTDLITHNWALTNYWVWD